MEMVLLLLAVVAVLGGLTWWRHQRRTQRDLELDDARAEAGRWYERLGGQVFHLGGEDPTSRQALADASERYVAAGSQMGQARTVHQFQLARETALEGLMYVQAARRALGMDLGPELPPLAAARDAGVLARPREVEVEGRTYRAGPDRSEKTPYYYPGGRVHGRPVPAGWYSTPLWNPATAGVAGGAASVLVLSTLVAPSFGDPGYDGYDVDAYPGPETGLGTDGVGHGTGEPHDPGDAGTGVHIGTEVDVGTGFDVGGGGFIDGGGGVDG